MKARRPAWSAGRPAVVWVVTVLCVALPALVAGAGIDAPVLDREVAHLRTAISDPHGEAGGGPAALYYGVLLPADASGADAARLRELVPVCRLASVFGILALSGLLYLSVVLARGRARAVLACVLLGVLPPVAADGAILRPEVPCAVFEMLAVLVLCGLPAQIAVARRRGGAVPALTITVLVLAVGTAIGLSVASLPRYGVHLLVPAGCMLLVVGVNLLSTLRVLRRFQLKVLPFRAFTLRVLPWVGTALWALIASALLLDLAGTETAPTGTELGLLPGSAWLGVPVVAIGLFGALLWMLQVALRVGRLRRMSPGAVLLVYALALLVHRLRAEDAIDALPAAPALAILVAEGLRAGLVAISNRFAAR